MIISIKKKLLICTYFYDFNNFISLLDMAVDVGDSTSVVDTINLTFVYDHINDVEHMTARPTIVSAHG